MNFAPMNSPHSEMKKFFFVSCLVILFGLFASSLPAADLASDAPQMQISVAPVVTSAPINSGDNAWLLASSALVLMMTAPGLILFYGGLVRTKNVLSTMM